MNKWIAVLIIICSILLPALAEEVHYDRQAAVDDFRFIVGLYSDQNFQMAKSELQKFIANYEQSHFITNAKLLLANIYLNDKEYPKAMDLFLELNKNTVNPILQAEIQLGLAQSYYFTKQYSNSQRLFDNFTRDFKTHKFIWKAHYFLSRIAMLNQNYQEALKQIKLAEKNSKDYEIMISKLEVLHKLNHTEEAAVIIDSYVQNDVKNEFVSQMIVMHLNHLFSKKQFNTIVLTAYDYIDNKSQYYEDYLQILSEAKYEIGLYEDALKRLAHITKRNNRVDYITALCNMNSGKTAVAEKTLLKLSKEAESEEIKTNSFFFLANLKGRTDIEAANNMLITFIRENPRHQFIRAAYYQLGFNLFQQNRFGETIENLKPVISGGLNDEMGEKSLYITAESYFQLKHSEEAFNRFNSYLEYFPKGEFADEALFKTALHLFEKNDYPNSLVKFDTIIREFPNSNRFSMALFYQGEIFTASNQYDIAFDKYESALDKFQEKGLIWLRIAQINWQRKKYDEAIKNLNNVPDSKEFLYEKMTIKGNIQYAKRDYMNSLKSYETAEKNASTNLEKEDSLVRQARALYQMKEYREATATYRKVIELNPKKEYLLMAATSAFTGEDYNSAVSFYNRIVKDYPNDRDIPQIKLHIADSYYNKKDYVSAANHYRDLLLPEVTKDLLTNSLNGLEWSARQADNIDFVTMVNRALKPDSPVDFIVAIYERVIRHYFENQKWTEVVDNTKYVLQIAPNHAQIRSLRKLMAVSLTNLKKFNDAESAFEALHKEKAEPILLVDWAELCLAQQDSLRALTKIKEATKLSNEGKIWLNMLQLSQSINDPDFYREYEKFNTFAKSIEKEQAQLTLIRWLLSKNRLDEAQTYIETLLKSSFEPIKARSQYFKGVHLYKAKNIEGAIPELLRVRYLYPRMEDVRIDAEILAIHGYIAINDRENALKLYDAINNSLTPEQNKSLRHSLGLEG